MICPSCSGSGQKRPKGEGSAYSHVRCATCNGTGEALVEVANEWLATHPNAPSARRLSEAPTGVPCPTCSRCPDCAGVHHVNPVKAAEIRARDRKGESP